MIKKIVAVSLIFLILILLTSCDLDTSREVKFYASSISGIISGSYYSSADSIVNNFFNQSSPWSADIESQKGDYILLTISGSDTLTARIYIDGVLFQEKVGAFIIQIGGYVE